MIGALPPVIIQLSEWRLQTYGLPTKIRGISRQVNNCFNENILYHLHITTENFGSHAHSGVILSGMELDKPGTNWLCQLVDDWCHMITVAGE